MVTVVEGDFGKEPEAESLAEDMLKACVKAGETGNVSAYAIVAVVDGRIFDASQGPVTSINLALDVAKEMLMVDVLEVE